MKHPNVAVTNSAWAGIAKGDPTLAIANIAEDVHVENGPGAGPWRVADSRDELFGLLLNFAGVFGDTFHQSGRCLYANSEFSVTLVNETGVHATSGDEFDNRALYISRYGPEGKVDRIWTVDLDSESVESFWANNPVAEA
jgi:hypothetical protein